MPQVEISDEDLAFLKNLAHEIKTQENHCTAAPLYYVVRTWRDYSAPSGHGDREVFVDWSGDPTTYENKEAALKSFKEAGLEGTELDEHMEKLEQFGMHEVSRYENVFFTKKGYEEHMRLNGHNYRAPSNKDPGFFVMHAGRNPEIKTLLEIVGRLGGSHG